MQLYNNGRATLDQGGGKRRAGKSAARFD